MVILTDRRNQKLRQIASLHEKRCGNCWRWMKSSCVPEKKHGQFKSCNSYACDDFDLKDWSCIENKFREELAEIEAKIKAAGEET
jgi:hypothetical protein